MVDDAPIPVFEPNEPGTPPPEVTPSPEVSPIATAPKQSRGARRPGVAGLAGARGLVLGWCVWLLGSWAVLLPMAGPGWAVRGMIMLAVVGLMALWPLVRLSQGSAADGPASPRALALLPGAGAGAIAGVVLEWLSLMAVFQAVVWPLRVTGGWGLAQALWLDAAVASWSLLTGALIALGVRLGGAGRSVMMVLCLLLLLAEPVWAALWPGGWEMRLCPIPTVWALTGPAVSWQRDPWAGHVLAAAAGAAAAWGAVVLTALWPAVRQPDEHAPVG